ncbi:MAG TPA: hypothetical protein VEY11_14065 [Pyrinomonadaceae bacterium]|nr:hypothetical protein [Pyrinomonadaceae bacterium]
MPNRYRMIKVFKYAAYAATLVLVAFPGCGAGDFASEYAIARHDLPGGKAIYFKREVRGVNGNYDVVAISPNGDPCGGFNGDTDYCICSWREYVYYKLEGDTLHLYYATANSAPAKQGFPVKVVNHEVHPMDTEEFRRTYAARGINRLELTIDGTKKCR